MMESELTKEQIEDLARPLVGIVMSFYADEENERAFQVWSKKYCQERKDAAYGQ